MPTDPAKGYRALRTGRFSATGETYFLTFCTAERAPGLHRDELADEIVGELNLMERECIWAIRCATVMPDHVHLLATLGNRLPLGRAVARLKAKTVSALRRSGLGWQQGYFDHRLRPREDQLGYFHYVFLNPYRAGLIATGDKWPWFVCGNEDEKWFRPLLNQGLPEPEWLSGLP